LDFEQVVEAESEIADYQAEQAPIASLGREEVSLEGEVQRSAECIELPKKTEPSEYLVGAFVGCKSGVPERIALVVLFGLEHIAFAG
jgi:hypothetical protein